MEFVYRRRQVGWAVIVPMIMVMGVTTPILLHGGMVTTAAAMGAGLGTLLLLFGTLTITVDAQAIEARFGIGLIKKRVALADLRSFEPATTPWYYGWGIRLYPGGRLYNVSGLQSVELFLRNGTRYRFGTREPGAVCRALHERLGELPQLSASERTAAAARSRRWVLAIFAVPALIFAVIGVGLSVEARQPTIAIDSERIEISSLAYGAEIELVDVQAVQLLDGLPPIDIRTNGFALGTTLRGHFRLTDGRNVQLFVDAGTPPFVAIEHAGGLLIVNDADPGQTRRLYGQLTQE